MSSIALTNATYLSPALNPFCDKNCKYIRVVADSAKKTGLSLFYRIVSIVTRLFSSTLSHRYDSLARFEWFKIHYAVYREKGKEIVDFSTNSFTRVKEHLPPTITELDAIKKIYGAHVIDQWMRLWPVEQLEACGFSRGEMVTGGCCFGMSLEFISLYLQGIRAGKSPQCAVKTIAPHFVHGASDKAQVAQIFYSAFYTKAQEQRENLVQKLSKEAHDWLLSEKERFRSLTPEERLRQLNVLKTEYFKRLSDLPLKVENDCARGALLQHHQRAATPFGIILEEPTLHVIDKMDVRPKENPVFAAFVAQLPPGIYEIGLRSTVGHSIVYIKTEEGKHFIYDPSDGTFALDPAEDPAARLWKTVRDYMITKRYFSIAFTRCTFGPLP